MHGFPEYIVKLDYTDNFNFTNNFMSSSPARKNIGSAAPPTNNAFYFRNDYPSVKGVRITDNVLHGFVDYGYSITPGKCDSRLLTDLEKE